MNPTVNSEPQQHRSQTLLPKLLKSFANLSQRSTLIRRSMFIALAVFGILFQSTDQAIGQAIVQEKVVPPKVGSKAPEFELAVQGEDAYVSLSDLVKDGPVAVVVLRGYPGYQCGMCRSQVGSLINRAKRLASATGDKPQRVVLVYPGPEKGLESKAKDFMGSRRLPAPFVMLRDPGMQMVTEWGLRWDAPRETAYPATFVVDASRRVRWAKVSRSHGGRTTAEEILSALKSL